MDARHLPRAHAAVVTHAVDIEAVLGGIGIDLEVDTLPVVHAHLGRKALDVRVSGAIDKPLAGRSAGQLVFLGNRQNGEQAAGFEGLKLELPPANRLTRGFLFWTGPPRSHLTEQTKLVHGQSASE